MPAAGQLPYPLNPGAEGQVGDGPGSYAEAGCGTCRQIAPSKHARESADRDRRAAGNSNYETNRPVIPANKLQGQGVSHTY
jgi:hypothetical protein